MRAAIIGIAGTDLLDEEAALLRRLRPAGVILFARNVRDRPQLRTLTTALRDALPAGAVLAVDQEGGRVARLRPPQWRAPPPAAAAGALYLQDKAAGLRAAWLTGRLIGLDCADAGLDMACAPVLDLRVEGASDVVGDRSFGTDPAAVAALGLTMADGLRAAGVMPVGKHAPGHGRALVDSHDALPVVPAEAPLADDLAVFRACADLPWMMTAHLLYKGFDSALPGTLSAAVIEGVIRRQVGFEGVLVSDDLAMRALHGEPGELARACLAAGCDVALHCTGVLAASEAVLRAVPAMAAPGLARMERARAWLAAGMAPADGHALAAERARLLAC